MFSNCFKLADKNWPRSISLSSLVIIYLAPLEAVCPRIILKAFKIGTPAPISTASLLVNKTCSFTENFRKSGLGKASLDAFFDGCTFSRLCPKDWNILFIEHSQDFLRCGKPSLHFSEAIFQNSYHSLLYSQSADFTCRGLAQDGITDSAVGK